MSDEFTFIVYNKQKNQIEIGNPDTIIENLYY